MIVVFGSLNIDLVMLLERLPQQGETLLGGRYLLVPGGKGANQACAAARAGARVAMVGCVGRDDWGDRAVSMLREAGVDLSAMTCSDTPTACASIFVDAQGQNAIGVASGANLERLQDNRNRGRGFPRSMTHDSVSRGVLGGRYGTSLWFGSSPPCCRGD